MKISSRNSKLIVLSQFFSACIFTIPIWIPFYRGYISVEQISFLVAYQYAIQLFMELPTGALADLIGRKRSVILGYIAAGLSNIFIIMHPSFGFIFLAATLAGLSEALISGSLEALAYDSCKQDGTPQNFSKVMAKSGFWFQIALAIGTFSGGFLYALHPNLPFIAYSLFTAVAVALSFWFIEPKVDSAHFSLKNYLVQMRDGTREAFKSRAVALMSFFYIAVAGITWTNQLYFGSFMMVELGFSDQQRSIIGGVFRVLNIFVLSSLLRNEKIFTRTRSILFFPIMMLVCYLPGVFFQGWWALPLVAGALMAGTARWIILTPFTNELYDSKYRATAISALSMFVGFSYVAITLASGPIIDHLGGVRMVYTLLGVLTIFTVVPLALAVVRKK